jgi:molybdenum cofactor cytidylyltransferase
VRFGPVVADKAEGAILAHSVRAGEHLLKKGTVLDRVDCMSLVQVGIAEVIVARLEPDDVHEDEAALRLATAIAGAAVRVEPPFTGRSNLHADRAGVLVVDRDAVDRLNRVDPAITLATLPAFAAVEAGRMVATVKIIPFAVAGERLARAEETARGSVRVAPFQPLAVGLVATTLPSLKRSVMDKTRRLLDERLVPAGARVIAEARVAHDAAAVAAALRRMRADDGELLVVFGASATVDRDDVVPAGIVAAGGRLIHFGMPVDPGNLLVLGELDGVPVIGAPGCARSPRENGFDWVLNRLLAGLRVTAEDLTGLGVGGLLMEIVSRPQPREGGAPMEEPEAPASPRVAAVILAAGESRRMGGPNKLAATIGGRPLVRIAAEAAIAGRVEPVIVVTGHEPAVVEAALAGLPVQTVHNPDYARGLSTSLRAGLGAVPPEADGVIVLLADMPEIDAAVIGRLIAAFDPDSARPVVVPTFAGRRGNPVLWPRRFFAELAAVEGDTGGRRLIESHPEAVTEVEIGPAVAVDVDTPEALAAAGGRPGD